MSIKHEYLRKVLSKNFKSINPEEMTKEVIESVDAAMKGIDDYFDEDGNIASKDEETPRKGYKKVLDELKTQLKDVDDIHDFERLVKRLSLTFVEDGFNPTLFDHYINSGDDSVFRFVYPKKLRYKLQYIYSNWKTQRFILKSVLAIIEKYEINGCGQKGSLPVHIYWTLKSKGSHTTILEKKERWFFLWVKLSSFQSFLGDLRKLYPGKRDKKGRLIYETYGGLDYPYLKPDIKVRVNTSYDQGECFYSKDLPVYHEHVVYDLDEIDTFKRDIDEEVS